MTLPLPHGNIYIRICFKEVKMAKKSKSNNLFGYIFAALVLVGLVLAVVGMFVGQITTTNPVTGSTTVNLFDESWGVTTIAGKDVGVSNTFAIIAFIVTLVGAVVLLLDAVLRLFLKKDLKIVRIVGAAVTLVGAVLILVSGLVMVSDSWSNLELTGTGAKDVLEKLGYSISCGAGVWLGFIGGLVATVGGALPLLKAFK